MPFVQQHQLSRRAFLKSAGILSAVSLTDLNFLFSPGYKNTGLQMYTMRHLIHKGNAAGVIRKIAAIGYKELEIFGYNSTDQFWGFEPKAFKKLLKANGLKAPSAHIAFEDFLIRNDVEGFKKICDAAATVGNKYVILAWLDEQYRRTEADYNRIAQQLNKAAAIANQFDLQIAYHNHDFEFKQLESNITGFAILLAHTDPKLVKMELDLYWCAKAGMDSIQLFKENPGRFELWHVKDMDAGSKDFTEVGAGVIDFKAIFSNASLAGMKHYFVEQDTVKGDVWQSIEQSYFHLKNKIL